MKYYERTEKIWIGNQKDSRSLDICITDLSIEIYIDKNNMMWVSKVHQHQVLVP